MPAFTPISLLLPLRGQDSAIPSQRNKQSPEIQQPVIQMYTYSPFSQGTPSPLRMHLNTPVWSQLLWTLGYWSLVMCQRHFCPPINPSSVYYFYHSGATGHLLRSFLLHWSLAASDESLRQVDYYFLEAQVLTWVMTPWLQESHLSSPSLSFPSVE